MRCASAVSRSDRPDRGVRPAYPSVLSSASCGLLFSLTQGGGDLAMAPSWLRARGVGEGTMRRGTASSRRRGGLPMNLGRPCCSRSWRTSCGGRAGGRLSRTMPLAPKKGPRVWGIGNHIDVRGAFAPRHQGVLLRPRLGGPVRGRSFSFSHRPWAFSRWPYRSVRRFAVDGKALRLKKTELGLGQLIQLLLSPPGSERDGSGCSATAPTAVPKAGRNSRPG